MIDYTGKEHIINTLIRAIREHTLCKIVYRGPQHPRAKTYTAAPYQLIVFHEALYARCRLKVALDKLGSTPRPHICNPSNERGKPVAGKS